MRFAKILFFVCFIGIIFYKIGLTEEEKVVYAVKIDPSEMPKIDGKLDEEVWKKAGKADGFIQHEPVSGNAPKEQTSVYVLYDKKNLYIGFICFKDDPSRLFGSQTKRDSEFFRDDYVEVFLDTYHDHRNCYSFSINCIGTQGDRRIANEGSVSGGDPMNDPTRAWDCAWEGKSSKNNNGWTAEMAIPFSELRFDKKGDGIWGINFWRGNQQFEERDTWANVGDKQLCVSKFGQLSGLELRDIETSKSIEFKPYAIAKPQFKPKREFEYDAGIDIRYPSSTITTDFTLNPDYGQIEADPERVNLDDVEERLPEKRPFFQEGMELFQMPFELFYTRRVGIKDLKYGLKSVGKIGRFNLALLDCQSNDEKDCDEVKAKGDQTKNNYLVFRTQTDIGSKANIGLIAVNKQKADGYNRAGGIDCNIPLPMDMRFIGQFSRSWFPNKNGNLSVFSLKRQARSFSFKLAGADIGRNFDVESGYLPRIDRKGGKFSVDYEYSREAKIFKMFRVETRYERLYDHDGVKTNESRHIGFMMAISDFFMIFEPEWYQHTDDFNTNIVYTNKTVFFFTGWFPPKWASFMSPIMIGTQENKKTTFIGPGLTITPFQQLKLDFGLDRFDREDERLVLNRRASASYQFSRQMFIKGNFEITRDEQRYIFFVYAWEFRPESNLYLVYSDDKDHGKIERVIFFKISYLLKLNVF